MRRYSVVALALIAVVVSLGWPSGASAQRYVDVPAGYGTLQAIIAADSANRAANPNTVYRLHRGTADSVYILSTTLTGWGPMPLQIESAGAGAIPTMYIATLGDGTPISPIISVKADFSMKGVYLRGVNTLGATTDRLIRIQASGVKLTLDSCQINMATQSFIRIDNPARGIYVRNCRVSNVFSDWANGRGIDNRGVTVDTLSVTGSTFYRLGQRAYRDGGGITKNAFINHNTFVDIAGPVVSLGSDSNVVFTNNLIVNCGFLGDGIHANPRLVGITPLPSGQAAYIANNVFYTDSAKLRAAYADTVQFFGWFADTLLTFIGNAGTGATNIHSPVTFALPPDNVPNATKVDSIANWYWHNLPVSTTNASILKVDSGYVNLAYNTNAVAYTWGADGKPAGSVEWFGIPLVGVAREPVGSVPAHFALAQNYPNPFNPSTRIGYSITKAAQVRLEIFNLLGQSVRVVTDVRQEPGSYTVQWDGRDGTGKLLPSGMYIYRLQADGAPLTKKMVLMK